MAISTTKRVRIHEAHSAPPREDCVFPFPAVTNALEKVERRRLRDTTSDQQPKGGRSVVPSSAEEVFELHGARVFNLARRMVNNAADAEDITQDVLLQLVRKLATFRGDSEFTTWLHRMTVNAALVHLRSQAPRLVRQTSESLDYLLESERTATCTRTPRPEKQLLDREERRLIDDAIATLPKTYRSVFLLAEMEGLTNAQIGAVMQLSMPAVKSRLHRARLMLREVLNPHFREWSTTA